MKLSVFLLFGSFVLFGLFFGSVLAPPEPSKVWELFQSQPYLGRKNYDKYIKRDKRVSYPTTFEKYPKKIPSFVDDTYCEYNESRFHFVVVSGPCYHMV